MDFERSLGYFSIFNTSTPSIISILIYLLIRKLNFSPSNILLFILGILNDVMSGVSLGFSSMFLLLIKFQAENLSLLKLNKNHEQQWFSFTFIFITTFFIVFLINVTVNLNIPDLNPLLFHVGTTLILFPIINSGLDLIFFITKMIKTHS